MGIMEKKMETTIVYRDYVGIMENRVETIIYNDSVRTLPCPGDMASRAPSCYWDRDGFCGHEACTAALSHAELRLVPQPCTLYSKAKLQSKQSKQSKP